MSSPRYDYIILGGGAAGLSLLLRLIDSGKFQHKKILLIDQDRKERNDRTWCYWEKGSGYFDALLQHEWAALDFLSPAFSSTLQLQGYRYKMIRGLDFYGYARDRIRRQPNIEWKFTRVLGTRTEGKGKVRILLEGEELEAGDALLFNSIYPADPPLKRELRLLQHFKGYWIRTDRPCFDPSRATLMDFRVSQSHGTSFAYVLPLAPDRALVEYTLFTPSLLPDPEYDTALRRYLADFFPGTSYAVEEEEFGVIPMSNRRLPFYRDGLYHIGAAGGQTKASTGYTFQFIQKQTSAIVRQLILNRPLQELPPTPARFRFYDSVLLQLLLENRLGGREIFSRLFQRNPADRIFRFLDNESSPAEEWKLILSLQKGPFLRAALQLIF